MALLSQLYRQNRWANLTLLEFCEGLSREQLTVQAPGTAYGAYGSIVHLLLNEEGYYQSITGEDLAVPPFDRERLPSFAELRDRLSAIGERYVTLAARFDETRIMSGEWEGQPFSMPAYVPLFQCINHGVEHREQAKAGLTVAGLEPPLIDVWSWEEAGRP